MEENLVEINNPRGSRRTKIIVAIVSILAVIGIIILIVILATSGSEDKPDPKKPDPVDPDDPQPTPGPVDPPTPPPKECTLNLDNTEIHYDSDRIKVDEKTGVSFTLDFKCENGEYDDSISKKHLDVKISYFKKGTVKEDDVIIKAKEKSNHTLEVYIGNQTLGYGDYSVTINDTLLKKTVSVVYLPSDPFTASFKIPSVLASHYTYSGELQLLDKFGNDVVKDNVLIQNGRITEEFDVTIKSGSNELSFEKESLVLSKFEDGFMKMNYTLTPKYNKEKDDTETNLIITTSPASPSPITNTQTFNIYRTFRKDDARVIEDDSRSNEFSSSLFDSNETPISFKNERFKVNISGDTPNCKTKFAKTISSGFITTYYAITEDNDLYQMAKVKIEPFVYEDIESCTGPYTVELLDTITGISVSKEKKYIKE